MNKLYIGLRGDYRRKRQVSSWLIDDLFRNDEGAKCRRIVLVTTAAKLISIRRSCRTRYGKCHLRQRARLRYYWGLETRGR